MKFRQLYIIWGLLLLVWQGFSQSSGNNKLYIPEMQAVAGSTASIPVYLDNSDDVVAFQFDLDFPDKISPVLDEKGRLAVNLSERMASDAVGTYNRLSSNKYRLLVFSSSNEAIGGSKGEILTFQVKIEDVESLIGVKVPFTITNMILTKKDAGRVNCTIGENYVEIVRGNRPDLEVSAVASAMSAVKPGEIVKASWLVRNIGNQPTKAGWKESVYLAGQDDESEIYLGSLNYQEILSAGGQVSRNAEFKLSDCPGVDGTVRIKVKLTPNADAGELEADAANNTGISSKTFTVSKVLTFTVSKSFISENSSSGINCYVYRSGNRRKAESFTITNSNPGRLITPASLNIPAGQSGASFVVNAKNDDKANPDSTATLSIQGSDYAVIKQVIRIEDDERPYLKLSLDKTEISEGEIFTLRLEREWDISWPLTVKLSSDHPKRFENFLSEVVIPGGKKTKEVTIKVKDDDLPGLDDEVVFTVSAPGHEFDLMSRRFVKIKDNDIPNITLELSTSIVSEANQVVTAILKRSGVTDNRVTVNLTDDGDGRISLPVSVVLEKGVSEKEFAIRTVDNGMKDGDKLVKITGAIYISSCNCSTAGTQAGVFEKTLTVLDDDDAAVAIKASKTTLLEGETGKITISVNQKLSQDLTINLSSENSNGLKFPSSATILAGQKSVDVDVTVDKNDVSDGNRTVMIVVEAGVFGNSICCLNITDQNLPDAVVTNVEVNSEVTVQSSATVKVTVKNEGAAMLPAQTKVSVYLSPSATLVNNAVALGTLYTQSELPVGESVMLEKVFVFPETTGSYQLIAIVNEEQSKKELSYVNNSSAPFAITLTPLYTVQVSLDKSVIKTGESVMITGQVTGSKTAGVPVDLYIINDGYRQVLNVKTDNAGIFQKKFTPEGWQMGHFGVGACYPGESLDKEMAGFDLFGLRKASNGVIAWEVFTDEKTTGSIPLSNPGNKPLSSVTAKVISQPKNCEIHFTSISSLSAKGTAELQYEVTGKAVSPGVDWEPIKVQIASAEGAVLDLDIYYYCRSQAAQLEVSESNLNTTMTIGAIREYPVTITNTGKGETGDIQVVLPKSDWMSLASPEKMPSLKYGESTTVLLRLAPRTEMEANLAHKGQFAINCANGNGIPISFRITPVSSEIGTLAVDVCDEYTYYTVEKPHVSGAKVRVTRPNTNEEVANGITGTKGLFTCELPAGYYTLEVTADKHDSYKNTILVDPGKMNKEVVDLSFRAITYSWTVEETTVEDEYEIKTDVKYETNVPVPVVVTEMPEYVPADELAIGESYVFEVKLTNKGLITANDVLVIFPQNLKSLEFELLSEGNIDLKAQQSIVIPVKMTRKGGLTKAVNNENSDLPCFTKEVTAYRWKCNEEHKWVKVEDGTHTRKVCPKKTNTGGGNNDPSSSIGGMDEDELYDYILKRNKFFADAFSPIYTIAEEISGGIEHFMCNPIWRCLRDIAFLASEFIPGSKCPQTLALCGASALASASDQYLDDQPSAADNVKTAGGCLIGLVTDCLVPFVPVVGQVGKAVELTAKAVNITSSLQSVINSCKNLLPKKQIKSAISIIDEFANVNEMAIKESKAILAISKEILGVEGVYDFMAQDLQKIRQYLLDSDLKNWSDKNPDLIALRPNYISIDDYVLFIQRIKNTYDYYTTGKCENKNNYINHEKLLEHLKVLDEVENFANQSGYDSFGQMYREKEKLIVEYLKESSSSVCSSVELKFSQSMVMTRQAFLGTLTINNTHETEDLKNVKLDLSITDKEGIVATNHEFQINIKSVENMTTATDGSWALASQQSGVATILFIPTKYAAPTAPKDYTFGGTLSYLDPFTGLEVTRDLFPATMTVIPSPNLEMDYFMQRDILGDDPLTKDVVEPMVPSEFSLLIHNIGAGDATNVRMTTKQPEITDNEKGLFVDFQIKTSQLNGGEEMAVMGENVATDFGTIKTGETAYAQWWLTSTLLGHFTDYKVEATHVTNYDNPDLSLLDTVRIHELIRGIRVNESVTPKVTGFMVNDIPDAEDFPDMMYLTDGTVAPVVKAKDAKLTDSGPNRSLTVTPSTVGWNYISIADPTKGSMKLVSVNGDSNLDTRKVWQTDRTLRDGKDPKYEYRIHVVDYFDDITTKAAGSTPGEFQLVFEERPEMLLAVESILGLPEGNNVATTPVDAITIKFNKGVSESSLTTEMFSLFCQGKKMDTKGLQLKLQEGNSYLLDLSTLTKQNGVYTLTIHTSEIKDAEGFTGEEDYSVVWNQLAGGKVSLTALAEPEKAGTVTPASIQVDYGKETEFVAKANKGYQFKTWTINDRAVSAEETYLHTAIVDQTLVANFEPISYKIEISYNAAQGFVTFGTGYYEYDSSLELIATPNDGYRFVGWFIGGERVSTAERFIYKISGDAKLEARFEAAGGGPDDPDNPDGGDSDDPTADEEIEKIVIQVYPTRVTDYVHVGTLPVKSRLILFNLAGKQVRRMDACEGVTDLFMGDQPSGIYLLYILAGEEQMQTVKLIKK